MIRARASRAGPETPAWTLLRSHEERFEDLGLSGPFLKAAFGFTEELIRAFILTRFDRVLGRIGLAIAMVVDSGVFGISHLYQGVTGAVQSGITGLLFALIFLKRRRVADSMVVHALFDLFGIALAYFLYAA